AARFSQRGVDRFAGLRLERGADGIPLLDGCAARFECRTAFQYEGGDHVIFVGEVLRFEHWPREPLVFKRGRFALAVGKASASAGGEVAAPAALGALEQDFLVYLLGRAYFQLYQRVRPELVRRGLADPEYFALSLLGVRDGRTIEELDAMLAYTGARITDRVAQRLADLGLVKFHGGSEGANRLTLTAAGRRTSVELLAVAQAASADGEEALDPSESLVLRQLLTSVIQSTDPGIAAPWQG
ncbi:MAG TPA: flavin reductase, partial [Steroidobacter sp.]|nr:flavin reductase [Steroidobacter sp.]